MKKTIRDLDINNKKVLIRVDFNVPLVDNNITDDKRIVAAIPTIKYALSKGAKVILFSHLGRVKQESDLENTSLEIVYERLCELLDTKVMFCNETRGNKLETMINQMDSKEVLLIQNTRYEDLNGKKESKNDEGLGKYWASLGDVFINDAFGTAHRAHASNVGIASNIANSAVGFLIEKELKYLGNALNNPSRPFVAIMSGSKVSDKITVLKRVLDIANKVIIGGGMAYTFLKAQGYNIGKSMCEDDFIPLAKEILELGKDRIVLPIDHRATTEFSNDTTVYEIENNAISDNLMCLDIGSKTEKLFADVISSAKTVIWNGPIGVFEFSNYSSGTFAVCTALANSDAITIVGGGDSASAVLQSGLEDKFTHISTGGGASLEFLEGKVLPSIDIIEDVQ
ncbi:MAG: phosphoglycerate kinase [Bacilli bacterium]